MQMRWKRRNIARPRLRARLRLLRQRRRLTFYDRDRRRIIQALRHVELDCERAGHPSWHVRHLERCGKDALGYPVRR